MAGALDRVRVDQVGSLLRPEPLKDAFVDHLRGAMSLDALRSVQDAAVRALVEAEERHGLPAITDGEFRRLNFMDSLAASVVGLEGWREGWVERFLGELGRTRADPGPLPSVASPVLLDRRPASQRLRLVRNAPLEEFRFTSRVASAPVKITLMSPHRTAQCVDLASPESAYHSVEALLADAVAVEREIVAGLAEAGCAYVQIDAPSYADFIDAPRRHALVSELGNADELLERVIAADNRVIAGFQGVTFGLHVCRGNRPGTRPGEGSYEPIAERLFSRARFDRLLLEYDTERAGGFEPLRFVAAETTVVLGLVSTKSPRIETVDEIRRRVDEAAAYVPHERLAISPQCGFASTLRGNPLTEGDQWRKFDVLMEAAARIWGAS